MKHRKTNYHLECKIVLLLHLFIWFFASFGCGILFRGWMDLNLPKIGSAPFGFWMAQQGSVIVFVIILISYAVVMNKLDLKYGFMKK